MDDVTYLQPRDVIRVEYYDAPKGKYSNDITAVNFVVVQYKYGGYVQASAGQNIGFNGGNYALASSISKGAMTYSLVGGYNYSSVNGNGGESTDEYVLPDRTVTRESSSASRSRSRGGHAQFRAKYAREGTYVVGKVSLSGSRQPFSESSGTVEDNLGNRTDYVSRSSGKSLSPKLDLNGQFSLGEGRSLAFGLHGTYSRNAYDHTYTEQPYESLTDAREHATFFQTDVSYTQKIHKGQLTAQFFDIFENYRTDYAGSYALLSRLWKNEALAFVSYYYPFNERTSLQSRIGAHWSRYQLKGGTRYDAWYPRLNLNLVHRTGKGMLSASFMLANSSYGMDVINNARVSVNPYMIRQGNPDLRRGYDTDSRIYYSLQAGKWNMAAVARYTYNFNPVTYSYSREDGHVLQTFINEGNNRQFAAQYSATFMANKSLYFMGYMYYTHTQANVGGHWRHNNFTGGMEFQWYTGRLAFTGGMGLASSYFTTYTLSESKMPFAYYVQASYAHKNLRISASTTMPFDKAIIENSIKTPFYTSGSSSWSRQTSRSCTLSLSYTFSFGKKVERDDDDVDTGVRSAILRDK